MNGRLYTMRKKGLEYYRGIPMHADAEVHEVVAQLVRSFVPNGARVLDVGAGSGALSQRLHDGGFDVTAVDVDASAWRAPNVELIVLDVERGIAGSLDGSFDAVCCVELIEHVENPWQLLRELFAVTRPGGTLVLSTPNVQSFVSRIMFLRSGHLHQFEDADRGYGHASPITDDELRLVAERAGWRAIEVRPGGSLPVFDLSPRTVHSLLMNVIRGVTYLVAKGEKRGWCLVYRMRKPE